MCGSWPVTCELVEVNVSSLLTQGRKRVIPVAATPSPNASAHEFLSPEQRHLLARKKGRSKLLSTPRQRKSRLFVVAEDGATIVITGAAITDRARAVEIADEKMPYVREKMAIIQNAANLGSAGGRQKGSGPSRIGQNKNLRLQHQKSQV